MGAVRAGGGRVRAPRLNARGNEGGEGSGYGEHGDELTAKEEPKGTPADLGFDGVKAFIGGLLMHVEGNGNVGRLAEGGVRCRVVTFAEMVDGIAVR